MRIIQDQRGTLVEYATMLAMVAMMAAPAIGYLGVQVADSACVDSKKFIDGVAAGDVTGPDIRFSWAVGERDCRCCIIMTGGTFGLPGGCNTPGC